MQTEIKTSEDIEQIIKGLFSEEIIDLLSCSHINKQKLLMALINSRKGFENILSNEHAHVFVKEIVDITCYQDDNYQNLVMFICKMDQGEHDPKNVDLLHGLYQFHLTLNKVASVAIKLLKANEVSSLEKESQTKVIPIFRAKNIQDAETLRKVQSF